MTETEILDAVRALVREHLKLETPVTMTTDIRGDLQLDSIKQLELVVAIENHFKIYLEADVELTTVGDVVRLIATSLGHPK